MQGPVTTLQPISGQSLSHVTNSSSAIRQIGMRLSGVFLEVEIATETSRTDSTRERLDVTVRVHVKRQVVHLQSTHNKYTV